MGKLWESVLYDGSHYAWLWWCPACDEPHQCDNRWNMTGTPERPTFIGAVGSSSILIHPVPPNVDTGYPGRPRCHSHVRDGKVSYELDSTHAKAGVTVELPDWPSDWGKAR